MSAAGVIALFFLSAPIKPASATPYCSWDRPGPSGKLETCYSLGNWEAVKATHGEVYYWNKTTSEVSWDAPPGWDETATAPSTEAGEVSCTVVWSCTACCQCDRCALLPW